MDKSEGPRFLMSKDPIGHHRLPAVIIAQFSPDKQPELRTSFVSVRRRGKSVSRGRAEKLTRENRIYDFAKSFYGGVDPRIEAINEGGLEKLWHVYENNLDHLLKLLGKPSETHSEVKVDKEIMQTMIPYLAGVIVRGGDFDDRQPTLYPNLMDDHTNVQRVLAWQKAQASIFHSKITYVRPPPGEEFILSDTGYCIVFKKNDPERGVVYFPVTPNLAFSVTRSGNPSYVLDDNPYGTFYIEEGVLRDITTITYSTILYSWRELYASSSTRLKCIQYPVDRLPVPLSPHQVLNNTAHPREEVAFWQNTVMAMQLKGLIRILDI